MKLLVYKDSKKNIHRVMKLRADRKSSLNNRNAEVELPEDHQDDQWLKDNIHTMEVGSGNLFCLRMSCLTFPFYLSRKCINYDQNWNHKRNAKI